jgi:putative transposase
MSIPRRHSSPGKIASGERTFFVTASTLGKRNLLQSSRVAELFIRTLHYYRTQGKYRLHEFVVMPNHFHLLITLGADITVEQAVQLIKGGFSYRAGVELGIKGTLWQRGFSEIRILDEETFGKARHYIWQNPVKANLAVTPEAYPYSSGCCASKLDPMPERLTASLATLVIQP